MPMLFLIVVIDLIGFGIIIPLLPFYAEHYQASPAQVGFLITIYSHCCALLGAFKRQYRTQTSFVRINGGGSSGVYLAGDC